MNELMNFEDFQHQVEMAYLKDLAKLTIDWYKLANIFNKNKAEPNPTDDPNYFEIPAFIREQVEQEQEVQF